MSIPIQIDASMKAEHEANAANNKGRINENSPRGLLGDRMGKVLSGVVAVLERGESYV